MLGEMQVIDLITKHAGTSMGMLILLVLVVIRFLPVWLANVKERRHAILQRRAQEQAAITNREHDLFSRLDRKDAVLEKITSNHVAHLEAQLNKTTQFFDTAIEHLRSMTNELKEIRSDVTEVADKIEEVKNLAHEIRGGMS